MKYQALSLAILLSLFSACQNNEHSGNSNTDFIQNGIVGGKVLPKRERSKAPWDQVIGVVSPQGEISCSATLMDETTVFTAAHCFISPAEVELLAVVLKLRFIQLTALKKSMGHEFEVEEGSEPGPEGMEDLIPYEEKVKMIDLQLEKYLVKLEKHMGFHFGEGLPGGKLKETEYKKNTTKC